MGKQIRKLSPPHDDVTRLQAMYEEFQALKGRMYDHLSLVGDRLRENLKYTKQDLVDIGFLCREIEDQCDDWRKDAKARKEFTATKLCQGILQDLTSDMKADDTAYGTLASARANLTREAILPDSKTEPGNHSLFMSWLNMPKDGPGVENKLIKPSWTEMTKYVTELAETGQPLPPGITRTVPHYGCVFTRRKTTAE